LGLNRGKAERKISTVPTEAPEPMTPRRPGSIEGSLNYGRPNLQNSGQATKKSGQREGERKRWTKTELKKPTKLRGGQPIKSTDGGRVIMNRSHKTARKISKVRPEEGSTKKKCHYKT